MRRLKTRTYRITEALVVSQIIGRLGQHVYSIRQSEAAEYVLAAAKRVFATHKPISLHQLFQDVVTSPLLAHRRVGTGDCLLISASTSSAAHESKEHYVYAVQVVIVDRHSQVTWTDCSVPVSWNLPDGSFSEIFRQMDLTRQRACMLRAVTSPSSTDKVAGSQGLDRPADNYPPLPPPVMPGNADA